ncbi:MAG: zinc-finger domain-containing protein [Magnetospirillum sp.]|nr:zinc-finger domain-containing protein [Magnetospirillum sp.]
MSDHAPASEPIIVATATVACDGDSGQGLGHPRIFLSFGHETTVVCPYCSRAYRLAEGAKAGGH